MQTIKLFTLGIGLLLLTSRGCIKLDLDDIRLDVLATPLVEPEDAIAPVELIGTFVSQTYELADTDDDWDFDLDLFDDLDAEVKKPQKRKQPKKQDEPSYQKEYLHIGQAGENFSAGVLRAVFVRVPVESKGEIGTESYAFFVKKIGDRYIGQVLFPTEKFLEDGQLFEDLGRPFKTTDCVGYFPVAIQITGQELSVQGPDLTVFDNLIDSEELTVDMSQDGYRRLNDSSEKLTQFFEKHGDKLFVKEYRKYTRQAAPKPNKQKP